MDRPFRKEELSASARRGGRRPGRRRRRRGRRGSARAEVVSMLAQADRRAALDAHLNAPADDGLGRRRCGPSAAAARAAARRRGAGCAPSERRPCGGKQYGAHARQGADRERGQASPGLQCSTTQSTAHSAQRTGAGRAVHAPGRSAVTRAVANWYCQGRKIHQRRACILYYTYLYCILYCICIFGRRPPVTVAAAASAMPPRVLAVHLALGYAPCLTLSSIM
jgi:hypothetical protein